VLTLRIYDTSRSKVQEDNKYWLRSSRKSSFAIFVRFFNTIGYKFTIRSIRELWARTNRIKKFYNSCKATLSAECSQWLSFV